MPLPPEVVEKYKLAGKIAREAREYGAGLVREGASLLEAVNTIEALIISRGARPAFPVNIAINDVAAHFTPRHDETGLRFARGDVVKLDVGVHVDGYIGDTATTIEVGAGAWSDMKKAAEEALAAALELLRPGADLALVGQAIETTIAARGFKPIENLTGHSLERNVLHAGISVPNIREKAAGTAPPRRARFCAKSRQISPACRSASAGASGTAPTPCRRSRHWSAPARCRSIRRCARWTTAS